MRAPRDSGAGGSDRSPETDEPDFTAVDDTGLPVMPGFSHVTRAHVTDDSLKILRRPYNYDGAPGADGKAERGPLNEWITPIGSAVFAVPPGCGPDGWVGEHLLS